MLGTACKAPVKRSRGMCEWHHRYWYSGPSAGPPQAGPHGGACGSMPQVSESPRGTDQACPRSAGRAWARGSESLQCFIEHGGQTPGCRADTLFGIRALRVEIRAPELVLPLAIAVLRIQTLRVDALAGFKSLFGRVAQRVWRDPGNAFLPQLRGVVLR